MRWRMAVVGMAAAVLTGCSGGEKTGPTATVGTAAATTTTTDPYAVPEVIDEAYVNRVLAGLDQAVGHVTRLVVQTRTIPPEAVDRLKALYSPDAIQLQLDSYQLDIRNGFADYEQNPGNPRTTVEQLITAKPTCIFARSRRDASEIAKGPDPVEATLWVALKPVDPNAAPTSEFNRTGWMFIYDGFQKGGVAPADPCAGS